MMRSKKIPSASARPLKLLSCLLLLSCALPSVSRAADLTCGYVWKPLKIGGGGWVVGLDISLTEKNLIYVRTDVAGAYRWDVGTSSWKQVVTAASMPANWVAYGKYAGVDSLVSAPKDPGITYMAFAGSPWDPADGQIFKSTDRGDHWTATNFIVNKVRMHANGEGRQEGERLAVDPGNSDIVYFGSIQDGLWTTRDSGATWKRVAGIPSGLAAHGVNTIHFDKGGGTVPAGPSAVKTRVIYVTVCGGGVFRTSDAGATWTRISDSGPGTGGRAHGAALGPDRTYYVAYAAENGGAGSVWKYSPAGVWTNITPPVDAHPAGGGEASRDYWDVAADPADAGRIVVMASGGKCLVSTDRGATWTHHMFHLGSTGVQWLGKQANYWLSIGKLAFDPFDPGKLWFAEGFGVWRTGDLTTPEIQWQAASEGIEETCGNDIIAPPGGRPVAAMWDVGAFYFVGPDTYTAVRSQPNFMACWALDWCAKDPKFIAGVFQNPLGFPPHPNSSGYSTDGGRTWTRFPDVENGTAPAALQYGIIAVSANSPDEIVWAPNKGQLPYYTTDRGVTWKQSVFDGLDRTGFVQYSSPQKPLCADRVLPDTFYFYTQGKGVFRSTDGGAHFSRVGNPASQGWNSFLKATPGRSGDLWFAEGGGGGLYHSTDGGANWAPISGLTAVSNVGLGKPEKPDGYPTLFAQGVAAGQPGIYRSTDSGVTWDKIGNYPLGIFDTVDALDGDKDIFGKVYVCFSSSGFAYGVQTAPSGKAGK